MEVLLFCGGHQHKAASIGNGRRQLCWENDSWMTDTQHCNVTNNKCTSHLEPWQKLTRCKLEAKDVLPNKLYAARRKGRDMPFLSLVTLTFKLVQARDQTCLPCEFGANPFSSSRDISYTNKKTTDWRRQKQNLQQFIACSEELNTSLTVNNLSNTAWTECPWLRTYKHSSIVLAFLVGSMSNHNFMHWKPPYSSLIWWNTDKSVR